MDKDAFVTNATFNPLQLYAPFYGSADEVFAKSICKHQIILVIPHIACFQLLPFLLLKFIVECIHSNRRRENCAFLSAFRSFKEVGTIFALKLLLHCNNSTFKIHAFPGKAEQFPLSHAGKHSGDEQIDLRGKALHIPLQEEVQGLLPGNAVSIAENYRREGIVGGGGHALGAEDLGPLVVAKEFTTTSMQS